MGSNIPFTASGQKLTAPFTPTQISGCQLWLDAADKSSYRLSGANLTSWSDKSGTGKTISFSGTPTYKAKATGNLPSIVFNSTMLTTTFSSTFGSGDVAYFAVWIQYTNNSGIVMTLGGTTTPGLGMGCNGQYNFFEWGVAGAESDYAFTGSITFNRYVVQSGTIRSNAMLCSVNGYSGTAATSSQPQTSTTFNIGSATSVGSGYAINGEIAEVLVYVGTISTTQQQQIEGYLAWKWGLQGSLNPTHPYATVNPDPPIYPVVPYPFLSYAQSSPEFDPRIFSGCILWLDGADPLATGTAPASGTNITTWYDKSRLSNNFTVTPSGTTPAQAFLEGSYPTISWTSNYTNGMVSASSVTLSANSSVFVVWKSTNATVLHDLLEFGSSTSTDFGLRVNWTGQAAATPNFTATNSNDAFYNNIANSSTLFYLNGTSRINNTYSVLSSYNIANGYLNTASTAFTTPTNIYIGYTTAFTGRNYSGYIGEIILYQTAITETQRQQVEAYLAKKWGLGSNLSSTNQYAPGSYLTFVNAPVIPALPMRRAVQNNKFLPPQYSNCVLWLDATDVNGTGTNPATGTITSWIDKSGSGNSSTSSGGTPTLTANSLNGKPGVAFSGTSYIQVPRVVTSDWSIFIVFSTTQTGPNCTPTPGPGQAHTDASGNHWWSGQGIFDGEMGGSVNDMGISLCGSPTGYLGYGTGNLATGQDTSEFSSVAVNTGAAFIGEFFRTQSSGNLQMFVNGAFQVSTTGGTADRASPNLKIGAIQTLPAGYYFTGNVYEIVCYSRVLNAVERQQIEGYFAWKWGLKASLTSSHPFFLIPPVPLP